MKRVMILALFAILSATTLFAAPMSFDDSQDIGALMATAQEKFDLQANDAVILLEKHGEILLADGRVERRVHRIVYINSDQGIRSYADLRIPYDAQNTDFKVEALRTWREEKWYVSGETASVETLPYAVAQAADYTNMREMMLLHDGIQLPCILECSYVITDKKAGRRGMDGVWNFEQDDPVVKSQFVLGWPANAKIHTKVSDGVGQATKRTNTELNIDTYTWSMGPLDALPRPHIADPASAAHHISWSTFANWDDFGRVLKQIFKSGMKPDADLEAKLDELLECSPTELEKAVRIAEFVGEKTRLVDYDEDWWRDMPRPAARTFETAYGHTLDRAILAAFLFEKAGFMVWPAYLGDGYGVVNENIATLGRMSHCGVWVSGDGVEAYFNPATSTLNNGLAPIFGKSIWLPGSEDVPTVRWTGEGEKSTLTSRMGLKYDGEKWSGRGFMSGNGIMCPFDKMEGLDGHASKYLESLASGIISGAKICTWNPTVFDRFNVTAGYKVKADMPKEDDFGRYTFTIGDVKGGVFDKLPHDVHLEQEVRQSPVKLAGPVNEMVVVRFEPACLEVVAKPEAKEIKNSAGNFVLKIKEMDDGAFAVIRVLELTKATYTAEEWTDLRALLLADKHASTRTVMFKK